VIGATFNMRQVQPETLPKNSNLSSCLQNIKLKINTTYNSTAENFGFLAADDHNE
jgi:hypothetical protein